MQQMERLAESNGTERKRVEAVVETLATLGGAGESLAEVAHDARNMVTALGLYCDLLEEPGVLATQFAHYGSELRLVAAASRRLVEKLLALDAREVPVAPYWSGSACHPGKWMVENTVGGRLDRGRAESPRGWDPVPALPIESLASELAAMRNLLAALAGPAIALSVCADGGAKPVKLTGEDLTRVLVNLVKNAAEAMPSGGIIELGLSERPARSDAGPALVLTVEDSGPGIPAQALERIFESGYTTHAAVSGVRGSWRAAHRGLGLSITRSIVEAAGGRIRASNRSATGARMEIELPVRSH